MFSVNVLSRRKSDDFRAGAYAARIEKTRAGCFTDFFMRNERVAVRPRHRPGFFSILSLSLPPSLSLSLPSFSLFFIFFFFIVKETFPPVRLKRRSFATVISNVQGNNQPRDRRPSIVRLSRPKSEMELDTRGNTDRPFFSLVILATARTLVREGRYAWSRPLIGANSLVVTDYDGPSAATQEQTETLERLCI